MQVQEGGRTLHFLMGGASKSHCKGAWIRWGAGGTITVSSANTHAFWSASDNLNNWSRCGQLLLSSAEAGFQSCGLPSFMISYFHYALLFAE